MMTCQYPRGHHDNFIGEISQCLPSYCQAQVQVQVPGQVQVQDVIQDDIQDDTQDDI